MAPQGQRPGAFVCMFHTQWFAGLNIFRGHTIKSTVLDWGSGEPQLYTLASHKLPKHQYKNTLETVPPIVSSL